MPRAPDREMGDAPGGPVNDGGDYLMTTAEQPLQDKSNSWDSSWPLFSIYSDAAKHEDKEMVEGWQKDAEGIIIFTGLFSAAVAVLLAVTVQDLRPGIQDTSAFYLGNIYQVLADPNVTRSSIPSPTAKPPPFSPPRYAVWVNTLWFLSLVMGLSCALWATSLQQWARRYLRRVQPGRYNPEKRAQMRAFFAGGVDKVHIPWAVEGLPTLLHLSLFLFFGGLGIFLFNINRDVFRYVVWWIGVFSLVYGIITLLPIVWHDSTYYSPFSTPAWFLYAGIPFVTFKILAFVTYGLGRGRYSTRKRYHALGDHYRRRMLGGVDKAAEETVSKRLSKIHEWILDWSITTLGNDKVLEDFFEALPGFLNSDLVNHDRETDILKELGIKLSDALDGFWDRTLSSNSASDSAKLRRLNISLKAMDRIRPSDGRSVSSILHNILFKHWDKVPQTLEMGQGLADWCTSHNKETAYYAQLIIARILARQQERNYNWVSLAARTFGLPEHDLWNNMTDGGDNVLLALLIHISHQYLRSGDVVWEVLEELSKRDIRNTLPRLQHDFCTLWNKIVQEARILGPRSTPIYILKRIRHLYIDLHQGTAAAPALFSASTNYYDPILRWPWSYPFCKIDNHHPDPTPHRPHPSFPLLTLPGFSPRADALSPSPTDGGSTSSRQAEQVNIVVFEPPSSPNPSTTSEIGTTFHGPYMTPPTNPVHSRSRSISGASLAPTAVVAASPQGITSTASLAVPHLLGGSGQQDSCIVAPSAEPGTGQFLSTASTLAPIPTSLPNSPSESYDVGVASVSNSSYFAPPSIGSSIPASRPTGSATLPRLRARGLVNNRNICFANAVLQLLGNLPPFWNLFRELGDLKGQRRGVGVPETGGGATPLVDATVKFFKEFIAKEESPSTQQQPQPATGGTSRADEEKKDDNVVDSFEPTYMYDAMKEKSQLKPLLDGQQQDAEEFLCLYLDALEEELPALLASIRGRQSASAALEVQEREMSQSGHTEVGSQGFVANFVESPITRIFGGKFRLPVRTSNKPYLVPTEDWRSLHLDIQHDSIRTVQDTLAHISQPHCQSVQVGASGSGNASQPVLIEALPSVLVLHLNRVRYDTAAGGITKIGKSIRFAPELKIPLDIMVPNAQRPSELPHYKLHGVLYHHGESAGSGHYTVDVLQVHPNGDGDTGEGWLHIDNEAVSLMRHEDVFREHGTERAADGRCAYLLFYCRTSPIGTNAQ